MTTKMSLRSWLACVATVAMALTSVMGGWAIQFSGGLLVLLLISTWYSRLIEYRASPVIGLIAAAITFVGLFVDVVARGPFSTAYNYRLQHMVLDAQLVDDREDKVIPTLGAPTSVYHGPTTVDAESGRAMPVSRQVTTYNFQPWPYLAGSQFQVHSIDGVVVSTETFDD